MLAQDRSGDIFIHGYRFISSEILYLLYIMKRVAVIFRLPENTDLNTMNKFIRGFYGQDSTSWKARYRHHRHGILEDIPHRKFLRGFYS